MISKALASDLQAACLCEIAVLSAVLIDDPKGSTFDFNDRKIL